MNLKATQATILALLFQQHVWARQIVSIFMSGKSRTDLSGSEFCEYVPKCWKECMSCVA
jgi:hypothetical protein